ncbi:MAG: amino acid ABC transporter substrate-binding protein [Chloroflexi bacterium]|nr:amino acid ABC transporter substrate-binding protein [Chloroflexota bacterium]
MNRVVAPERLWLLVLAMVVVVVISCAPKVVEDKSLQRVKEAGELIVGIDPSYPPFAAIDGQGRLVGYDVDLAEYVARQLGVRAGFVSIDIGSIQDGLLAKKFDVIVSSLPPFPEFTKKISYSRPYFNAGQVLVVNEETDNAAGLDDLDGKTLGVEGGSAADVEMRKLVGQSLDIAIRPYQTAEALLSTLKAGGVDAAAVDVVTAMEFARREKGVKIIGKPLTMEPFVIAVRRDDAALLNEIDGALFEAENDGTADTLLQKWLGASAN